MTRRRGDALANRHQQQDENALINNRQQNGRRRGRGGQPQRNGQTGAPDRGNRLDNRARGNAAQLLEKYKTLARDAQMQGDRVNTEYYLQFADHYFRVLSESRSRFEEQNNQRRAQGDYAGGDYNDGGDNRPQGVGPDAQGRAYDAAGDNDGDGEWDDGDNAPNNPQPQDQGRMARDEPRDRGDRPEQRERNEQRPRRNNNNGGGGNNGGGSQYGDGNGYGDRNGGFQQAPAAEAPERIEFDRIPPSLTSDAAPNEDQAGEEAAPRRRPRRPREAPAASDA